MKVSVVLLLGQNQGFNQPKEFNDGKRSQVGELVEDKDAMADIIDISGNTKNCLPFKNNIEYE